MFVGLTCGHEYWGLDTFNEVEGLGFDGLFCGDHLFTERPVWDGVTMATAMACATERITIGTAAIVAAHRHPTMLAKELIGIDRISGGRLAVAIGAGGNSPAEFQAAGVSLETRGKRTTEAFEVLRLLFSGERVSYSGETATVDNVLLDPPPARPGGPPLWVAGRRGAAKRRAAKLADGFLPYMFRPEQCAKAYGEIEEIAEAAGRNLGPDFVRGVYLYMAVGDSSAEARRRADQELANRYREPRFLNELSGLGSVAGTPEECVEGIARYAEAGASHVILHLVRGEEESPRAAIARAAERVLGPFKRAYSVSDKALAAAGRGRE